MAKFELVEVVTKDKLMHQGIFFSPEKHTKKAILWVHGLTDSFYGDPVLMNMFADTCDKHGMAFVSFNNRGHEYLTSVHQLDGKSKKGYVYKTIGSSVEIFSECVLDIDAAIHYVVDAGYTHVVLVGHSTGANKVCYYAAKQRDRRVIGIVLAGPISDRYSATDEKTHQEHKRIVKKKIIEGHGDELLFGLDYFPMNSKRWQSLLEEGSIEDVFNYRDAKGALATYEKIRKPMLVMFGGNDEHADRPISEIRKAFDAHAQTANYQSLVIPNADHGFSGKEKECVSAIVDWATSL